MKLLFKLFLIALAIPMMASAADPKFNGKHTKEKSIHKEYNVSNNAILRVDNSYGNIDIVTWNENRIVIDVLIRTNGNNEEKVQKKLESIEVEFSASSSEVSAQTRFRDKKSSWNLWGNKNNNVKMEINYTIKMPRNGRVDLRNDYGSINLNELDGHAKISCDYGQINIGKLMSDNNDLDFDYTKNSNIGYMKAGNINADYSSFTLERTERLDLNADYTQADIHEVGEISYNNDYGKITIGKVGKLVGVGDYIPLRIDQLTGSLSVNTDYGSVAIDEIMPSVKEVNISSDYAGIKLGYNANFSFDFNIELSYANLSGEEDLEVLKKDKGNHGKSYSGFHKSRNSGNIININSEYGGVSLRKL